MTDKRLKLRDFIASRREEILNEIYALQQEMHELKAVEDTLDKVRESWRTERGAEPPIPIRDKALRVLHNKPEGGTANQICDWIREAYNEDISRQSLSPQLSRLKKAGYVSLDRRTKVWRHCKHIHSKNNAMSDN